jgi:hypothetical protein
MNLLQSSIMTLLFSLQVSTAKTQSDTAIENSKGWGNSAADSPPGSALTITRVKKPWYAWRKLIVGKMKESLPEYMSLKGLHQKYYSFTQHHHEFGGIYFWQSVPDAQNWFDENWYRRTEKKYGKKGVVEYYHIIDITTYITSPSQYGHYCAVLSASMEDFDIIAAGQAIIRKVNLQSMAGESCCLTLWTNKRAAEQYFTNKALIKAYFDVPIVLRNVK